MLEFLVSLLGSGALPWVAGALGIGAALLAGRGWFKAQTRRAYLAGEQAVTNRALRQAQQARVDLAKVRTEAQAATAAEAERIDRELAISIEAAKRRGPRANRARLRELLAEAKALSAKRGASWDR